MILHHLPFDQHDDRLEAAVARGIITREQHEAILAIGSNDDAPARRDAPREMGRALDSVYAAYGIGACVVLFAFGWFLVDRWRALGAGGIFGLVALYAAILTGTGVILRRQGFPTAGGLSITLAVALAPLLAWSGQEAIGLWPDVGGPRDLFSPYRQTPPEQWVIVDLATIGAALVALRHVRFPFLVAPIGLALWALAVHLGGFISDPGIRRFVDGPISLLAGTVILAIAYAVDRRDTRRSDFAGWLYVVGLLAAGVGYIGGWSEYGDARHFLPLIALLLVAVSLFLRRRVFLVAGMIGIVGYLGYLAFDVFRDAVSFPVVLATFGIAVILVTVLAQQRYPRLVRRIEAARGGGQPALPGGWLAVVGPVVVALALLVVAAVEAPERARDEALRQRMLMRHSRNANRREAEARPHPRERPRPETAPRGGT